MSRTLLNGRVTLHAGDCLAVLPTLAENSVDAVCTDPPYHLTNNSGSRSPNPGQYTPIGKPREPRGGFMGKKWDGGDIAFRPETWAAVLRVLKPGGHMVAFAAPKNAHRMICAIEDAGFEIRDTLMFLFGSGFPKNLSVNKALEKDDAVCRCSSSSDYLPRLPNGAEGSARLEKAEQERLLQPVVSSQGPCCSPDSILRQHEGADAERPTLRRGESGLEGGRHLSQEARELRLGEVRPLSASFAVDGEGRRLRDGAPAGNGRVGRPTSDADGMRPSSRSRAAEQSSIELGTLAGQSQPQTRRAWEDCPRCSKPVVPQGLGSHLKPAYEPIVLARKPLSEGTIAANVLKHGTGALNIGACRIQSSDNLNGGAYSGQARRRDEYSSTDTNDGAVPLSRLNRGIGEFEQPQGRFPANIIHDGSDEVVAGFPESASGIAVTRNGGGRKIGGDGIYGGSKPHVGEPDSGYADSGSAARFFYTAKADADDRIGSKHPTVKPLDLMQYLVRLVTPPRGVVLDCFAGTGTTGEAAWREGFSAILIEREPEYLADIERRMALALAGPDERARESIKARLKDKPVDAGPLFDGAAA